MDCWTLTSSKPSMGLNQNEKMTGGHTNRTGKTGLNEGLEEWRTLGLAGCRANLQAAN